MDSNRINILLSNDALLERFTEILIDEINEDDESFEKKGRQLLEFALDNKDADDFFIAICGWSIDSLLEKTGVYCSLFFVEYTIPVPFKELGINMIFSGSD